MTVKTYICDGIAKTLDEWAAYFGLTHDELYKSAVEHDNCLTVEIRRKWRDLSETNGK